MRAVVFYVVYAFLYLIASLPFRALYLLSDVLFVVLWLSGYRKKVILQNLRNSFPEKTEPEIDGLARNYCRYLCDLILETLKTLRMTEREARERCTFNHAGWLDKLCDEKRSILIVMGHYGNWEWGGPGLHAQHKISVKCDLPAAL